MFLRTLEASEFKVNLSKAVGIWGKLPPAFNMVLLCFILPFMAEVRGQVSSFVLEGPRLDSREGRKSGEAEETVKRLEQVIPTVFIPGW